MSFVETLCALLLASLLLPPLLTSQLSELKFFTSSQRVLDKLLENRATSPRNLLISSCQVNSNRSGTELRRCLLNTGTRDSIEHFIITETR